MATNSTRAAFALALLTVGSFALAACSSGTPDDGAPAGGNGSTSAPAEQEQEQETSEALSVEELGAVLEGAGLTLMSQDQVDEVTASAGSGITYDSIEPAQCETLLASGTLAAEGASVAMGTDQASGTIVGGFSYDDSSTIDTVFSTVTPEAVAACPEYTATTDGQTVTGTIAVADVTVSGADSAIALHESADMAGLNLATTRITASKGNVLVTATAVGEDGTAAAELVSQIMADLP